MGILITVNNKGGKEDDKMSKMWQGNLANPDDVRRPNRRHSRGHMRQMWTVPRPHPATLDWCIGGQPMEGGPNQATRGVKVPPRHGPITCPAIAPMEQYQQSQIWNCAQYIQRQEIAGFAHILDKMLSVFTIFIGFLLFVLGSDLLWSIIQSSLGRYSMFIPASGWALVLIISVAGLALTTYGLKRLVSSRSVVIKGNFESNLEVA